MVEIFAIGFSLLLRIAQKRREFDHQAWKKRSEKSVIDFRWGFRKHGRGRIWHFQKLPFPRFNW